MPAEQEIVHWYNRVPDLANGDIPDDYPVTPDDYPANRITELHDLLNRLCDEIGNITYDISNGTVHIVARGLPNGATFTFGLYQWLTNEREVKSYLREWFPSFNIPYTMGGIMNHIVPNISGPIRAADSSNAIELVERVDSVSIPTPTVGEIRSYIDSATLTPVRNYYEDTRIIPIEPHPRNPFNDIIREALINVAICLDTHLHYAITDTHVKIEDRDFDPVYTLSLRLDVFEARALPIVEISRRIQAERASMNRNSPSMNLGFPPMYSYRVGTWNPIPDMVIRPLDNSTNPSPCTGKEEASDINYLDVI